jgi:hypothetical protein
MGANRKMPPRLLSKRDAGLAFTQNFFFFEDETDF